MKHFSEMYMLQILDVTLVLVYTFTIVNHFIGITLLFKIFQHGRRAAQEMFLLLLSITAITRSIFSLCSVAQRNHFHTKHSNFTYTIWSYSSHLKLPGTSTAPHYRQLHPKSSFVPPMAVIDIIIAVGVFLTYILNIVYILIDKFLQVYLHMRYMMYVDVQGATYLQFATCVSASLATILFIFLNKTRYHLQRIYLMYFYLCIDVLVILLACFIYIYIFGKYRESRCPPHQHSQLKVKRVSSTKVFLRSRFTVSAFLVLSYVIFMALPDAVTFVLFLKYKNDWHMRWLWLTCCVFYALSDFFDAVIYIFMYPPVRKVLRSMEWCGCMSGIHVRRSRKPAPSVSVVTSSNASL